MDVDKTTLLIGIAFAVQAAVIGLAALAAARGREWWPFSHYPMFAGRAAARGVRFFCARFTVRDGRTIGLTGLADALVDPFHRRCEAIWPEEGAPDLAAARTAMLALWREACALNPALTDAVTLEIVMRTATVEPSGDVRLAEAIVQTAKLTAEEKQ